MSPLTARPPRTVPGVGDSGYLPPRPFNIRMVGRRRTAPRTSCRIRRLVVIHRNHRCETVLPEHGDCGAAGGCGAVWRSADDGELPYPRSHHRYRQTMTRKNTLQRYLGRQPETGIQQQPGLVPVGHADHPRYGMGKRLGARTWTKGAVCHRAVL